MFVYFVPMETRNFTFYFLQDLTAELALCIRGDYGLGLLNI